MTRSIRNIILAFGSVVLCTAGLQAQTYKMRANIPFAFEANGKTQEPGEYIVERPQMLVWVLENTHKAQKVVLGPSMAAYSGTGAARLVFHRYGSELFLAQVWNYEGSGTNLPVCAREKEIQKAAPTMAMSVLTVPFVSQASGL